MDAKNYLRNAGGTKYVRKGLMLIKLLLVFTIVFMLPVNARSYGQSINLELKNASLEKIFLAIEKQGGYHFIYAVEELQGSKLVSIDVKNATIQDVMNYCVKDQPVTYTLQLPYIVIKKK